MQEVSTDDTLDAEERTEAKKRSEESMNFMYYLQQQGTNCDCTLHTDDGAQFAVHSAIMCRCSPYFQALFTTSLNANKKDITIPGVVADILRLVIQYAYTRKVAITLQNASDLMVESDQFGVVTLVDQCSKFMSNHLDPTNCVEVFRFARNYFFQKLEKKAYQYIMKYFVSVSRQSTGILDLNLEEFIELIACDELNVSNEAVVWEIVVKWIDFDSEKRAVYISDLLSNIRLGLLDPKYFREKIKMHHYVKQNEEKCHDIIIQSLVHLEELDNVSTKVPNINPNLCKPRFPHQLMFAVGGWSGGNPTEMIETYDIRADRWAYVYVDDSPGPRAYHGCVVLGPEIYVIGGFDGMEYFNGCWSFNVCTQRWKEIAPMHCQRCYVSVALLNGKIYAMGGYNGQHRQNTAEVYCPATNQWNFIAPMHMQRSDADATVCNNKVYIVGGFNGQACMNSVESYDPNINQWTMLSSMRVQRSGVSCVEYQGYIYAVGGFNGAMRLCSAERYDITRNIWVPVADMNNYNGMRSMGHDSRLHALFQRYFQHLTVLDDHMFVIGGFNGVTTVNEVECFDSSSNSWFHCRPMNVVRSALAACIVSDLKNLYGFLDFDRGLIRSRHERHRLSSSDSSASPMERSLSD